MTINFLEFGNGHTVVFLHGWGANAEAFLFTAKSVQCHAIIPDLYGFGKTPHPNYPLTVSDYADGVIKLLEENNIKSAIFVGHSFGGRVALEIAGKHKEFVEKLVLVDSAGIKPRRHIKYYLKVCAHKVLKRFKRGLSGSADYMKLSPVMKKTFINVVNYDETYLLKNITAETLIFWGENDHETPLYMARKFKRKIKNSALFILTNAGHFSYLDNSTEFNIILSSFIND